jgi:small subunit ribosomal protein S8
MDTLANALTTLKNHEALGKKECEISPASKLIGSILKIMQREGFIGNFEFIDDGKSGFYNISLIGKINNCRVIKPRYSVAYDGFLKWEKRYLPAKDFGVLIVSTPHGIVSHHEAKQLHTGGKLLAFIY